MERIVNLKTVKSTLPLCLLAMVVTVLYLPAIKEFIYDWSHDDNYSHGFLIPVVSIYLLWQKRDELRKVPRARSNWGLMLIVLGLVLNLAGTAAAEWFSVRFSIILVLLGLVWYFAGSQMLQKTWFPIAFLVFAIPIPYTLFRTLTFPLQLFSTKITHNIITAAGVPALREGNIIYLQGYTLEVVEACSGLRSIITLSALAAVFSYLNQGSMLYKIFLFSMAVPIAIVANIVRLSVTSFGALLVSSSFADGFLHEFSGIVVFMVGLTLFIITGSIFKWIGKRKSTG